MYLPLDCSMRLSILPTVQRTSQFVRACVWGGGRCRSQSFLAVAFLAVASGYTTKELEAFPKGGDNCSDTADCWGNGECNAGKCVCDAAWTGGSCQVLHFIAARPEGAFRKKGWATWGGSPYRDENGTVHLFASLISNHCPLSNWQNNSLVVHLTSDSALGPFHIKGDYTLPPFHHNPSIQRAPDGTYVLYFVGGDVGNCTPSFAGSPSFTCNGPSLKHCSNPQHLSSSLASIAAPRWGTGGAAIHLASASSLYGPWTRQPAPILFGRTGRWDEVATNPAPFILRNGTALLSYRGIHGAGTDRIGVARAPSWRGNYARATDLPVFGRCGNYTPDGGAKTNCTAQNWGKGKWVCDTCLGWAEDPFLWASNRGYHMLTHNLRGVGGRKTPWCVGLAFSKDFKNWQYSTEPAATYTFTSSTDGKTVTLHGRERPQLLLSNDTDPRPLALYSAVSTEEHEGTFTFVQGLASLHDDPDPGV